MSSQKIPRSPNLSPTKDVEQSFFRVVAFRSSEELYQVNSSEASTPISPLTQQTAKQRPSLRAQSEALNFLRNPPMDKSMTFGSTIHVSEVAPGEPPLLKVTRPSEAGYSNSSGSRASSRNSRARNFIRGSWSRSASASTMDAELQQETKLSPNRKRVLPRHLLEIYNRRKMKSDGQSRTNSEDAPFDVPDATPIQNTPQASEVAPIGNSIPLESSHHHDKPAFLEPNQKNGFYYRAKLHLGLGQEFNDSAHEYHRAQTFTEELLERASTMLRDISGKLTTPPSSTTSGSNKSNRSNFNWHTRPARLIPFYSSFRNSSSSSIHHAGMGNAPQASPNSQSMYTGSDSKQYFRVEISNPDGPSYLPSEARRINTPPSPKSMSDKKLRGFFFDYNAPNETILTPCPDAVESQKSPSCERRRKRSSGIDWYRVKLAADEAKDGRNSFELNVPEHLPNSPLCPRNPKHRSGGKGICVYHGRNKELPLED